MAARRWAQAAGLAEAGRDELLAKHDAMGALELLESMEHDCRV